MTIGDLQLGVRPIADVQELLQLGQEHGYVASEEIMTLVKEYDMTMEEIEDLYSQLFDQSTEIYEQSPVTRGVLDNIEPTLDLSIQTVSQEPIRLYLREAGTIPLLTRDEETQLAKGVEMGDKRAKAAQGDSPRTTAAQRARAIVVLPALTLPAKKATESLAKRFSTSHSGCSAVTDLSSGARRKRGCGLGSASASAAPPPRSLPAKMLLFWAGW
jgi:hypothetical protein